MKKEDLNNGFHNLFRCLFNRLNYSSYVSVATKIFLTFLLTIKSMRSIASLEELFPWHGKVPTQIYQNSVEAREETNGLIG